MTTRAVLISFPSPEFNDDRNEQNHPLDHNLTTEFVGADGREEDNKSYPPSPPESGTSTPSLRANTIPTRLTPVIPPPNYGAVEHGNIFRSAFPQDRNTGFLKLLRVKHVLCLVDSTSPIGYNDWILEGKIRRTQILIAPNKYGEVETTWSSICRSILTIMDPANQPGYIHCNQGRHRTGCVVACLRKVQRWPMKDIITEYETYAAPKIRTGDIELIRNFDPEAVYQYSQKHNYFSGRRFMRRSDSVISNIDTLVAALTQAHEAVEMDDVEVAIVSQTSSESGDGDEGLVVASSQTFQRRISSVDIGGDLSNGSTFSEALDTQDELSDHGSQSSSARAFTADDVPSTIFHIG